MSNANDHNMSSSSQSIWETGSHEYKIKGYSLAKGMGVGKFISSAKFTVGGYDWVIDFYPDGLNQANHEYISLCLKLQSPGEVRASFQFKLLDQSGEGIQSYNNSSNSPSTFEWMGNSWGRPTYIKRTELETSAYLKDDCLIIHCMVGVVQMQTHAEEQKQHVFIIPPSEMIQNLKGLLESEIGYDITLHAGNEFFRAHKSILASRSPVFKAMFFGLVGNNRDMDIVEIKEIDPLIFKAMLLYLYSDELPETCELFDSDSLDTTTTFMQHLLVAADRFHLARLEIMCQAKLCEQMTANTVATTLDLAERHHFLDLKTVCLNFAAKPENLEEVMKSDGYTHLDMALLTELLKTGAVIDQK